MHQNKILKTIFFLIVFIAIFHVVSYKFYLYNELWWIDIIVHFLGGFWTALFSLWLLFFSGFFNFSPNNFFKTFLQTAAAIVLFIGITWEIFELKTGITFLSPDYWTDTILDVFFDLLGAVGSAYYSYKLYPKSLDNLNA